jgi:hypothetical protein
VCGGVSVDVVECRDPTDSADAADGSGARIERIESAIDRPVVACDQVTEFHAMIGITFICIVGWNER